MRNLYAPRHVIAELTDEVGATQRCRTGWISDIHLGTRTSNALALLEFLREYDVSTLYIVGDLIDVWQLRRGTGRSSTTMSSKKSCERHAREHMSFTSRVTMMNSFPGSKEPTATLRSRSMAFTQPRMAGEFLSFMVTSWIRWCRMRSGSPSQATLVINCCYR
jgi:hypothetical protein